MTLKEQIDSLIEQSHTVESLIRKNGSGEIKVFNKRNDLLQELYKSIVEEKDQLIKEYFKSLK